MINIIEELKIFICFIEDALGIKLYDNQVKYILGEIEHPNYDTDRGTGKTTAYCIQLALSRGVPLDFRKPFLFSDAAHSGIFGDNAKRYSNDIFLPRFLQIRERLSTYGFKVRDVYDSRRKAKGGFIVGD
jgi:hypothetical protein